MPKKILALLLIAGLLSCTSIRPKLDPQVNYQRDVRMEIQRWDGTKWLDALTITGAGIMPRASHYNIRVLPPGNADMITVTSCHRELKTPNPEGNTRWNKGYTFMLRLSDTIDQENDCSIDIGVYEKDKGRHAWGLVGFENQDKYSLAALTKCNGRVWQYRGTSACQAKEGLIQQYEFKVPVAVASGEGCEIKNLASQNRFSKVWQFIMPSGECKVFFLDPKAPEKSVHQAFLFGYSVIPIRGIK